MAEFTKIQWADKTFNPYRGCSKVSDGCKNCYAATQAKRNVKTLGMWGPQGTRVVASEAMWREPVKWNRAAKLAGERPRVFCASMADVFEDWQGPMVDAKGEDLWRHVGTGGVGPLPDGTLEELARKGRWVPYTMDEVRWRLFDLIASTPSLDWLVLTKRPENVMRMLAQQSHIPHLTPNVWLGTSVEDQATADERIPHLLEVPAAVRFLSVEPLLGPVDLSRWLSQLDWVIVGGES